MAWVGRRVFRCDESLGTLRRPDTERLPQWGWPDPETDIGVSPSHASVGLAHALQVVRCPHTSQLLLCGHGLLRSCEGLNSHRCFNARGTPVISAAPQGQHALDTRTHAHTRPASLSTLFPCAVFRAASLDIWTCSWSPLSHGPPSSRPQPALLPARTPVPLPSSTATWEPTASLLR